MGGGGGGRGGGVLGKRAQQAPTAALPPLGRPPRAQPTHHGDGQPDYCEHQQDHHRQPDAKLEPAQGATWREVRAAGRAPRGAGQAPPASPSRSHPPLAAAGLQVLYLLLVVVPGLDASILRRVRGVLLLHASRRACRSQRPWRWRWRRRRGCRRSLGSGAPVPLSQRLHGEEAAPGRAARVCRAVSSCLSRRPRPRAAAAVIVLSCRMRAGRPAWDCRAL